MTLFLKNLSPNVGHYFYTRRIAMSYEYEIAYDISKLQEWEHVGEGFVHEDKRYALLQSKKHPEIGVWLSFNNPNTALKIVIGRTRTSAAVSYTHLRAHETDSYLVCR